MMFAVQVRGLRVSVHFLPSSGRKCLQGGAGGIACRRNRSVFHMHYGRSMKSLKTCLCLLVVVAVAGSLAGCTSTSAKTPGVSDNIRASLDKAGYKDVSVSQDSDKGVVTLGGHVAADTDKAQAQAIATSFAGSEVVSNQVAVIPPGSGSDAKDMNSDLDKGVASNLDAALINAKLHDSVKYAVKNHVVTLTGDVDSEATRDQAQMVASAVPNVQQVVNELQVKSQKATSSN
jgi:hyperosmotically inducible periplasmic protein